MEIKEKITLDMLTSKSVSVLRQRFIEIDGVETQVGGNVRNAYSNDVNSRSFLSQNLPEEYYNAIISVWGDLPTDESEVKNIEA